MSFESVTISKEIEVEVQIDFVKCNNCGEELDSTIKSDSHGDIQIYVDKCACEYD